MSYNYGPPTEVAQQKLGIRASDIVMASDNLYCSEGMVIGYSFVQIPVRYISAFNIDLNQQGQADTVTNSITFLSNIVWLSFSMIYIDLKRKGKKKD